MAKEKARTSSEDFVGLGKAKGWKIYGEEGIFSSLKKSAPNISGARAETGETARQQVEGRPHSSNLSHTIRGLSQAQGSDTVLKENLLSSQECKTTKFIVYSSLKHRKEGPDPEKGAGKPGLTSDHCSGPATCPASSTNPQLEFQVMALANPDILQALIMRKASHF